MRLFSCIIFFAVQGTYSQIDTSVSSMQVTLPEIILMDVEPNSPIDLSPLLTSEAGASLTFSGNSSKWINFSSAVSPGDTRNITAQIDGALPSGTTLQMGLSGYSGLGNGTLGTQIASPISLSSFPQNIITGIGGAYTGNGVGNGYQITFTLNITDFSAITASSSNFSILYTITSL